MSKNYNHLNTEQRYQIEALIKSGNTQKSIAENLGVSPSTISRELSRNTAKAGQGALIYKAQNAQRRSIIRHKEKPKHMRFTAEMKQISRLLLINERYSPELISVEGKKQLGSFVSHETIYKWIWQCKKSHQRKDKKDRQLYNLLKHGHRRRKRGNRHDKRGNFPYRVMIDKRPSVVLKRKRLGDIEVDLMLGKKHQSAILVCIDRASLKVKLRKLKSKQSKEIKRVLLKAYQKSKDWLKTITFDNDSAFMLHHIIAKKLNVESYFTRPYTSQDKGSVENRIGVLRRFLPKGMDLTGVTARELQHIENKLNNRPVRKFNYKTPNQVFSEKIALTT
jgi:transposase, IS30 family